MTSESMYTNEERERRLALIRTGNTCAYCNRVAWSLSLEALMQLRPKRNDPDQKELLCGECCAATDAKRPGPKRKRRRRAA
jgi:hypothetical protein